jgi:hypothetical protein
MERNASVEQRSNGADCVSLIHIRGDRTFVPAIETAAGPAPEWFTPEA